MKDTCLLITLLSYSRIFFQIKLVKWINLGLCRKEHNFPSFVSWTSRFFHSDLQIWSLKFWPYYLNGSPSSPLFIYFLMPLICQNICWLYPKSFSHASGSTPMVAHISWNWTLNCGFLRISCLCLLANSSRWVLNVSSCLDI